MRGDTRGVCTWTYEGPDYIHSDSNGDPTGEVCVEFDLEYTVSRFVPATRIDPPEGGGVEELLPIVAKIEHYGRDGQVIDALRAPTDVEQKCWTKWLQDRLNGKLPADKQLRGRLEEFCLADAGERHESALASAEDAREADLQERRRERLEARGAA